MKRILLAAGAAFTMFGGAAWADTISPLTFSADLAVGESVTIEKTVVVEKEGTSTALIDVMFLFDVTGSMGDEIVAAKSAADAILTGLSGFGDLASGTGWYSDPKFDGVHTDLTTTDATTVAGIDDMWEGYSVGDPFSTPPWCSVAGTAVGCGGDFPEQGNAAIKDAADNSTWRAGSNRFIVVLGDASFKSPPTDAATMAALTAAGVSLIGVDFGGMGSSVNDLGGETFAASATPATIVDAILDGVTSSFATYSKVTVDDLGGGMPEIDVSTVCTGADIGMCVGDTATGMYDRSVDRTFTFDVTFKRVAAGDSSFLTHALVDGGIVASEKDRFPDAAPIPLPAAGWMMIAGLGGLLAARRRRKAA